MRKTVETLQKDKVPYMEDPREDEKIVDRIEPEGDDCRHFTTSSGHYDADALCNGTVVLNDITGPLSTLSDGMSEATFDFYKRVFSQ